MRKRPLTQALLYRLRTASPDALAALYGMDEGLERRFLAAAQTCASREALLDFVKTKRDTRARLSRLCAYALLDLSRDFAQAHRAPVRPRPRLPQDAPRRCSSVKRRSAILLVTKAADFDRAYPLCPRCARAAGSLVARRFKPRAPFLRPRFHHVPDSGLERQVLPMRLFAYPAALLLAFILYCAAPKLPAASPARCKSSMPSFSGSTRALRASSPSGVPLTLMLVPFLLALLHPAVEAVLMAFPLFGLSASRKRRGQARADSGAYSRDIPAYESLCPQDLRRASPQPSSRMSACRSC